MTLPDQVDEVVRSYLRLTDQAIPGLIEGLYLHGSVALGDFRPDRSDIDFLVLTPTRAGDADLAALADVHRQMASLHPRPFFDGVYLTREDLVAGPNHCPDVPGCLETEFAPRSRFGLSPVMWHELDAHGVAVRGPELETLERWTDQSVLLDYTRTNLDTYWRGWIANLDKLVEAPASWRNPRGFDATHPWFVEWCVLGVVRLHALLATESLHSKGSAGRYALNALESRWRPILTEALRIRDGDAAPSAYADPRDRLRDTREFVATIVALHHDGAAERAR